MLESFLGRLIILGRLLTLKDGLPKSPREASVFCELRYMGGACWPRVSLQGTPNATILRSSFWGGQASGTTNSVCHPVAPLLP